MCCFYINCSLIHLSRCISFTFIGFKFIPYTSKYVIITDIREQRPTLGLNTPVILIFVSISRDWCDKPQTITWPLIRIWKYLTTNMQCVLLLVTTLWWKFYCNMLYIKRNICMVKQIFNLRPHLLKSIVHVIRFMVINGSRCIHYRRAVRVHLIALKDESRRYVS